MKTLAQFKGGGGVGHGVGEEIAKTNDLGEGGGGGRVFFFCCGCGGAFFFLLRVRGRVFFFAAGAGATRARSLTHLGGGEEGGGGGARFFFCCGCGCAFFFLLRVRGRVLFFAAGAGATRARSLTHLGGWGGSGGEGGGGAFFFLLRVRGRVFFFAAGAGARFFFCCGCGGDTRQVTHSPGRPPKKAPTAKKHPQQKKNTGSPSGFHDFIQGDCTLPIRNQ